MEVNTMNHDLRQTFEGESVQISSSAPFMYTYTHTGVYAHKLTQTLNTSFNTFTTARSNLSTFWQLTMVWFDRTRRRRLPNEEGGCRRWGRRRGGGCIGDGRWESRLAGAPQSAGRQGAAAAAGAGGHGGDWGLRRCDVPVCFSHQTLGLLTRRNRDKTTTITYKFYCSCPPSFHSIYSPYATDGQAAAAASTG